MNTNRDLTDVLGYIYKITSPLGDVYIGQTISVKDRKYKYKKEDFKKQTKLWNNCQKYGWNPLDTFEIIDECLCGFEKLLINEKEIYWISYYDSFNNGLNCTEGGRGQVGRIWTQEQRDKQSKLITEMYQNGEIVLNPKRGHKLSEEHKEKIRQGNLGKEGWNKGQTTPDEVKEKIRISTSGVNNKFYGKKFTEEHKAKLKEARAKQVFSEETRKKMSEAQLNRDKSKDRKYTVSVLQYDLDGNFIKKFASIKEAGEKVGLLPNNITRVCRGYRKSAKNFIWKYESEF